MAGLALVGGILFLPEAIMNLDAPKLFSASVRT